MLWNYFVPAIVLANVLLASAPLPIGDLLDPQEDATGTPTFTRYVAPASFSLSDSAAEPTVGVNWISGAIMYQALSDTYRLEINEATSVGTWSDVSSPYSIINIDPILFTDHVKGRTFAGGLDGACSVLSYTDNDGAGWTPMGNSCAGVAVDHPTIGSGAWQGGKPITALYDRVVYYCAQTSVAKCATSSDGGITFGAAVPVPCGYINPGLHGSVHVGANGWAYLPFRNCAASGNGVSVSRDNGLTWTGRPIPGAAAPADGFDPDVATTTGSWAYVAYPTSGNGVGVALTKDGGATWTNFGDVAAAAGIRSATFHEMVAGDNNRAAVAFLGSTTDGNPHDEAFAGVWRVYVSYTFDGGATWTTVQASSDIVQRGWICAGGTGCGDGRNLLDFIDAQVDKKGRVVVGYADGCVDTCETGTGASVAAFANVVAQTGGKSLFAAYD